MIAVSAVSPGKVQHRTGTPSRVAAIAITTCGRSPRWSLECPNARVLARTRTGDLVVARLLGQVGLVVGDLGLPVGARGAHDHDVQIKVEQVCHRREGLRGDLVQTRRAGSPSPDRPTGLVIGEPAQAVDRDPLADPSGSPPASTPVPGRAARPARTPPAQWSRRHSADRRRPGGSPHRSRAAPRAGPASMPHPGGGNRGPRPRRRARQPPPADYGRLGMWLDPRTA